MKRIKISQTGDTILEVMLAIAIVGFILAASYGLANDSRQATQRAQERGEALKYAEGQVEKLKKYLSSDTSWNDGDCMQSDGSPSSSNCGFGTDQRYRAEIKQSDPNLYSVNITWDRIGGAAGSNNQKETIAIKYRNY